MENEGVSTQENSMMVTENEGYLNPHPLSAYSLLLK